VPVTLSAVKNMSNQFGTYITHQNEQISLRLIGRDDAPLLVDLFKQLSPESRRLRFHLYTEKLPDEHIWQEAIRLANLDPEQHLAVIGLITETDGRERAVGVARFARSTPAAPEAEVAIVVRDDFQRKGLGRYLLEILAEQAREVGITHLTGWVAAENLRLMKLIKKLDLTVKTETRHGEIKIRVAI
jgi:GNAT superfamily N-acetyltransferase